VAASGSNMLTGGKWTSVWRTASKGYFLFFMDINTQTDQLWQFFMTQFSVVVRN